ncbi:dystonin isoform X23 [Anolis sagrei]|uniref:dystonin isoform X23 n=1 Tax=Anolis sagrei TaxID=38937 RepID=UPI003521BB41
MIAAAFLVLLRPYSIQCALLLLLLLLGTVATILFFCSWHRKLHKARHPIRSVFSGRARSRDAAMRTHHFRSEVIYLARNLKGFRPSPRHIRRRVVPRLEENKPLVEARQLSEEETSVKKRKVKKVSRVQPEFYHSVQVTPTRKPSSGNASYRCSISSSADFSDDDEDFSQKSGSLSPAPGDTLPWNLPKHERSKRKIQGGSVLDPAERAVLRIADERDKVQKKTFTKWINQHLMKVRKHVNDLYEDLRDGHNLISLLEVLSGDTLPRERDFLKTLRLVSSTEACPFEQHEDEEDEDKGPREKGRMRFHRLQNVQIALDYLKRRQVKLVNIRNDDITDGNPKLTLGLIWTIILHFQISDIHVTGESEDMSAKERLLLWTQQTTEGYAGIRCENFTTCWRDGKLFNAIIHKYRSASHSWETSGTDLEGVQEAVLRSKRKSRPDLIDMNTVAVQSNLANLEHAFFVAEKLGVARLLDPEDVDVSSPDEKSVITYVSSLYDAFPKVPEGGEGISAHDVEVKWVEYQNMVNYLIQWIRHHATIMSDRAFPNNPVELKALYNQYLQFKETEIPPKETEKSKIKHLYKLLEVWIEFGRIKLPQGYHPNDIEKEWGKLIIAMLEREKMLRPEVERLEMLQQIANRIQRDSLSCEDKLMLARNAVQSDGKRLESGLQFQNEAEIAGYLLECENLLRQQVIDAQLLIDGKYYQADQLVQRVAKLRDDLMALRAECSSIYSKGRTLTTEQTRMMISGITQSLNSGFAPNLSPGLNSGLSQGLSPSLTSSSLTSGLSSGLSSRLTPAITPAYTPGFPPRLIQSYITGVDSGGLQTLKLMQIRKPLMKSAFVDQNLTEEEVNMKFVQDLLRWVDEMQVQLDRTEWGSDLPSVESHVENHKNVHKAIEEFESSLKEAKISEMQMTAPLKLSYAEKLHKLESQYAKLLNTSRNQERHLDTLHNFVSRATRELIWLNEKEEEEVAYDWSERNTNIARKKEYHAELMRELDQKEEVIKSVQEIAEQLLFENHPARLTIEAYRAAMQTQWSWILQLCQCVEQHLRENIAYFEFFNDAKEATDYLRNLRDAVHRKYSCDRSSSLHKLEDLIQESMEEKEQLLHYKNVVAGLVGRAKTIVQLKPRNPDNPLKTSIPIKAICDYRQIEITIYKDDECVLASNSHRAKWKVISPSGNEAMVPSVCFTVPPPNKEAIDTANRIEQQYQNVLALWHESHINMKSVVSWHYLTNEIETVRASNVASIKTLLPGEHQQVLSNLQSRFDDFLEDSQESKVFSVADIAQLEREVNVCKQYYQELLKSAEREEHEESVYNLYISEVRNIRLRLENCEDRLIRQIRTPLERDDLHESVFRVSEQEKLKKELERLKEDLETITDKCDDFFNQATGSPSVPTLRSELNLVIQNMNQVYSMSSIYIEKLKTVNLVLKNTQGAEALVKLYETKLCEEDPLTADKSNIESLRATLKQWRSEVDEKREVFHALEDELQKAKAISDQMFKTHKERDLDLDWHKEKADQLTERWQNVHSQIENRLHDLEGISKSLKYYRDTYGALDNWIKQVEETQQKFQENPPQNSRALAKQLNQQKMLIADIEMKQNKLDECQKYSEQYSTTVKDYELQTMTYRAMVDSQQKSPVKRRRMQSSSDFIIQEFMDLRTRYTALMTLMTQYIKFAGDSLKRLEEEEKSVEEEKKEHVEKAGDLLKWVSNVTKSLREGGGGRPEKADLLKKQISADDLSMKKEQISEALQTTQTFLAKHGDKMTEEEKNEMENHVKSLQEGYKLLSNEDLKQLQEEQSIDDERMDEKLYSGMQPCLWYIENLRRHLTVFQDMKFLLDDFQPISNDLEALKVQLEQLESFESRLGGFAVILHKDMKLAEEFLKLQHKDVPREQLQDLKETYECLENNFLVVCEMSSKRAKQIVLGVESEMAKLTALHQEHLVKLQEFTDWIMEKNETIKNYKVDVCDIEDVRQSFQFFKDLEKDHGCKKIQLESTAFDIQFFISEHAQDLSPNQSKQLLKLLNSTQKHFREVQETIQSEVDRCETLLQTAQRLVGQKDLEEQHQDFKEKLQDICDLLTQTENQLIGHQEALVIEDSKTELQQCQTKQEELQKNMQANTQALAEIVKNTEMFLKENGEKLLQEDKLSLEKKLNEAKTKCLLLSQKAEESRKELDKAVTTALKHETEKVAAREQLEESKNTIENLLDWLSNVDKDADHGKKKCKPAIKQNGNHFQEEDVEGLVGEEDEVNGNLLDIEQENEIQIDGQLKPSEDNLNMQYQKAKAQHEKLISQQQAVIIATQSAQALLEKQGHHLLPEEKEKIQRNMKELKVQYDTTLAESEQKLKLTRSLQEELEKFDVDYGEFESWLQQAEQELENLETGASDFSGIVSKLKRQKSFSEDVISHKGDLRYITISGQRVLDAAKSCNQREGIKYDKEGIDTSSTFMEVQNKLDSATGRFKSLYSKCSILGNNLKDLVDKYQNYEDASSGLLSGLQDSEEAVNKHLSEAVAADPKNLQRQLEETKVLQGQVSGHQMAVEKLKKAAEVLFDTRGELLPDKDEIQNTLDTIVDKYNQLSKAVNDRNEKLQITLTRSLSVQDGLDEMLDWMNGVEKSLEEQGQVPLNSAALQDVISKSMALEQDILSRQSSLNAMKEKMSKCMETADPSTASSLQAKMNELSVRFAEANRKHKEKLGKMEELQSKVELFECLSGKLQSFLDKKTQALSEADVPGKDVTEMSQYVQETNTELMEQKKDLEVLQHLIEELSTHALPADKSLVLEKVKALLKKFKEVEEAIQEKEDDVSSCQQQMDAFNLHVESLKKWIDEVIKKVPDTQPSLNTDTLKKHLQTTKNLEEEWSSKAPDIQKMITRGTVLCNLISAVTSPAKSRGLKPAVSGLVLNGEGATVGTQDFLSNKELTTVQHSMSAVNKSYDDLGTMLKKKTSELESMLSNMQNVQEESNSMMDWLQKMDTATAKWETAPLDTESVKEQVDQHKLFETELKQNENKVQELKDRVTELLEKNPDSPEAPKWKQMLEKIDSKWKELSQVTADRQKKLEESSNYLTQFQTTEAQLKQWLVEKELMVSVLGPLSIDPNMLSTQKQQVQILLKEFDTRKPQYEQLSAAGQGILKRPGEHPPSHETVKQQLAAVTEKWGGLTGQLSDRCSRIDQAIVKSTEYQNCLRRLSEKLGALDNKLSQSLAISTDPDAVKQQLELAREVKEEIKKEMLNIDAAEILCKELSELVAEDYLKAELARQLEGILKPFKDMEQKAGNHIEQLQSTYASSHQFQQMSKDFQVWLDKQKEEQNRSRPISARMDSLRSLVDDQKEFKARLSGEIGSYEKIIAEGESLLQKTQGVEKAELQSQLNLLKANWEEMNKQVKERQDKLNDCVEKALRYKEHVEALQPWIAKCESNVSEIKMGIDPVQLENSITQVKTWQKDLDKHQGIVELLRNAADTFLNACETDKDVIEEEKTLLIQKMNVATEQLQMKRDELEKMSQKLKEFQESSREVKEQLKNAREQLEVHESLKPQTYSNKHLTIMQAQQKALQITKNQVDLTKKLAQELVVEAVDSSGISDLLLHAEALEKEYSNINEQVEQKCSFLESKLQGIGHFQNVIREMFSQFAEFDDELDSMAPVSRDLVTLQSQQRDIKAFLKKLEELITNNENANKTCKAMLANEAETSPDLAGIKRDLEALNKQCNKLLDRGRTRDEQIEGTINRMEEFYCKLQGFSKLLGEAVEHEESQGPVAMETETINQQLSAFKVFEKEAIEPLQVKQQEVNWLGQGLIQSAAKNTSTENLEHDLEDVNTKWKTLNKKVAQRAAQLQEALLHCGRFQDAVESILSWLIDTEDLVANQKPPSAEFKVVKAQIQEQKLLQRLLDDRKPTVELIKREGEKIAESAEPADKEKILKQLSLLDSRWDALLDKAERRNCQLEGISVVAQQFHETFEPLVEWIAATEKRLSNSEPIGTQASKLQQQISQHKALEEDISTHNTSLQEAIHIGQALKTLCSKEDKDMVQEKLDSSEARYTEIQEKYSSRAELLQQAYCNAQIFGEDEVELMNWLNEVHEKLSKLAVQDYNTDLLGKQHTEMLVLQEEIVLRKQNVDQAIQNGLELLKQTTGDEVIIIQDKLEGIKARYKDITKLSSDVSKTLEQALKLSGQLQCTHEELCTWLDKVEVELSSYDSQVPKGKELNKAQERQKELKKESKDNKTLLDTLNEVSSALLELVPWRAREGIDRMVTEDNERYRTVSDSITQKVEETDAAILRSQQFDQAANTELAWVDETGKKLMSLGDIRLEREQTTAQLQVQKAFTMEILKHKDTIEELVASGDEIMKTCTEEEKQAMKKKLESLVQKYDILCQMNSKRNLQLERAQSLVSQFWETHEEIWPWLTETKMVISQLPAPALEYETLKQQQEEHRQLRELIAEHKPHIDKMNKTGPQLLELSPREGFSIQEKYVAADALYSQIKEDVKKRAQALDEAISQSTQFHDKIDSTIESLERIVERLRQPPSISAEVEKIKEQISENKNVSVDLEKLQPVYETLKQRGEEMIARSEGADKDISAKVVQDKLDQMVFIWEDIHTLAEEREAKLLDAMELAEKFWCDHMGLVATIKDTQDFIRELEGAGIDPSVVKQQQEAAESIKEEVDGLQEELDAVVNLGSELIAACGEPDKPLVNKSIDELNSAWDALNKSWKERVDKLEEAMQAAVQYQDGLQAIFDWVDIAGSKLASMSPVGTDLETVKQQTEELKQFKKEAYQQQIEMERLNHQAELLLKKVTEESDKHTVQEPLSELKLLWESLEDKIVSRQHKLEGALLALGQFQHALDELLTWLTHTEDLLNDQKPVGSDPKAIEIELAKHHVLQNDVLAHQSTVETVKKAGNDLIQSSAVEEASNLQSKLELLNQRWQNLLEKTEKRKQQLDSALIQAQGFHGEVEDLQQWLTETERQLLASKPVGGLPETAREQLNTHMELCAAFEAKEETYKCLMQKGLLASCPGSVETNVDQDINNLKEKWESVETKLNERKIKLEEALSLAVEFHNSLQDFINWLTQAEQTLTVASRPSLILDTVLFQIDEHKVFANEVNAHRDQIIELDKTGTHLKYFSQKQDVVLIKNLLISVQSRWEKVVQRLVERGRALDDARKRAKQFHEAWNKLTEWLDESEKTLDAELEIANDPDKIKMQLSQHKEFQKALGAKHSVYDTTNRSGRSLKEKTTLADDNLKLDDMLSELRDKWDTVCGKSVERQNKLEEALLFSGQFTDALQALIDWLYKVEPQLAEDQPVHGDIDLVMNLIDSHKAFQKELGKRTSSVQALKRSARELIEGSRDDSSWVKVQMQELGTRWDTVCALSISKQTRLEQALNQAEEFHSVVHVLLEWLAEAEQALRFHGVLPDDEEALRGLIEQHREFMKKLEEKKAELNKATGMGEAVLAICHPDSITTIKHWITIIRARFEEVLAWAKQHQQRLAGALAALIANQELLEALLSWLQWAETTLTEKDKEAIPQEIDDVKALIAEHQTFMEEMTRKQPDVDKVTKTHKRKTVESGPIQSHIPVLDKGRGGRKRSPTPSMYPSGAQTQIETKNPRVNLLVSKWQQVWLLALERRRKLNDALDRLEELREFANFDFDIWRKKYMRWMNHKKSRVMDFFRRIDKDQDGKITRQEFIDGILSSKFPTSRLEMSAVADIFDRDGDGYIDYYEFVAALHPNKDAYKPLTDADKIEDEVTRQVAKCKCAKRFQVEQIGDNKYRFFLGNQFGDSQQLRLVRILRSTVMVRVGGGWMALDEFLVKNDPCRVHHHGSKMLRSESNSSITTQPTIAKGRTNMELREKFILADGASQSMAAFRPRGRRSRPSSRGASPNRSMSVSNPPAQGVPAPAVAVSTPKTPHHLTRNYGKPWLINSKTSSPCKPPECSEYQVSSTEGTPIQGSKLRLPGYLSGKGFHSGEDSGLISTAATRVRAHFADTRKTPSRPGSRAGSKAGSRASSRRGSDASDFDISEIQSVCSDVSETVHTPIRPTPRPNSRSASGKPSKIPTPQRRSPAGKVEKASKR